MRVSSANKCIIEVQFSPREPFIFFEIGGTGGIWGSHKKTALKGGASERNKGKGGGKEKILVTRSGRTITRRSEIDFSFF